MKTIGIIGGLGPASTLKYYEWLNEGVREAGRGHHSARIILSSLDGADIAAFRKAGDDPGEGSFFAVEARRLERAGADFLIIASNTSHKNAEAITAAVSIPLLHLAEVTADKVADAGIKKVSLLGTAYTMEQDFYKTKLISAGIDVIVPEDDDRAFMTQAIYDELVKSIVRDEVKERFRTIITTQQEQGAQGVILGCTELTLLGLDDSADLPLFDTARLHVRAALDYALADD